MQPTPLPVLLTVLALCTAAAPGGRRAAQAEAPDAGQPDEVVVRPGTNSDADRMLETSRRLAADGSYVEAIEHYHALIQAHDQAAGATDDGRYLPMWRLVAEDVSAWPPAGQQAWRDAVNSAAEEAWTSAVRSGDLMALERVAQRYLLSDIGPRAAVALGDRLREAGMPALALYYYGLVLGARPAGDVDRRTLRLRAALAAREAGLEDRAKASADTLQGVTLRPDVTSPEVAAAGWLAQQAMRAPARDDTGAGFGNVAAVKPLPPDAVLWQIRLAGPGSSEDVLLRRLERRLEQTAFQLIATAPGTFATLDGHTMYAANLTSAWAVDTRTGRALWRRDTCGPTDADLPPTSRLQARQPAVADGVVYVPLEVLRGRPDPNLVRALSRQRRFLPGRTDLVALDARTGDVLWSWTAPRPDTADADLCADGRPVVAGDRVYVALSAPDSYLGEIQTAALDRRSGRAIWIRPLAQYDNALKRHSATNAWLNSPENISTSLAERGGLLISCGVGLTTVQSGASGAVLWSRSLAGMHKGRLVGDAGAPGALVEGMVVNRLPRVLADRGLVVSACMLSPYIEAYDMLDGRRVWRQDACGARHLAGLAAGRVVAWGRTVAAFDLATGAAVWPEPVVADEPFAAEPVVGDGTLVAPTVSKVLVIDLDSGKVASQFAMPESFRTGNLALSDDGLVAVSDRAAAAILNWPAAKKRYLALAEASPADPEPLVVLGTAALRANFAADGLDFLGRVLAAEPTDAVRARLYRLYEGFFLKWDHTLNDAHMARLLRDLRASAGDAESIARQAVIRGRTLADRNPREAVAAYQEILDRPDARHVVLAAPIADGTANAVAETGIAAVCAAHGRDPYRACQERADAARRAALETKDVAALIETARRYPNSPTALGALDDALELFLLRNDLDAANRLLLRLTLLPGDADRWTRLQALLVDTSQRLGLSALARLEADVLIKHASGDTPVRLADGRATTVRDLAAAVAAAPPASGAGPAPTDTDILPPYRRLWRPANRMGEVGRSVLVDSAGDARPASERTAAPLVFRGRAGLLGVDRADGNVLWRLTLRDLASGVAVRRTVEIQGRRLNLSGPPPPTARTLWTPRGLVVVTGGTIAMVDPVDGRRLWRVPSCRPREPGGAATRPLVTGTLDLGDCGDPGAPAPAAAPAAMDLRAWGNLIVGSTGDALFVIDARDGYVVRTHTARARLSFPFACLGRTAVGFLGEQPYLSRGAVVVNLGTGDVEKEIRFDRPVTVMNGPGNDLRTSATLLAAGGRSARVAVLDLAAGTVTPWCDTQMSIRPTTNVFARRGLVYVVLEYGTLAAFDPAVNKALWTREFAMGRTGRPVHLVHAGADHVVLSNHGTMAMWRLKDGSKVWEQPAIGFCAGQGVVVVRTRDAVECRVHDPQGDIHRDRPATEQPANVPGQETPDR